LKKCKVIPVRFESDGYFMVATNVGSQAGHYDASLGKDDKMGYFRVHAPNPTDKYV
jgi:hypothetical protein